jgi:hypothetical protein
VTTRDDDTELSIRVIVHLVGEAFEALGYEFWCHDFSLGNATRHDCAIQKPSGHGGKYRPIHFELEYDDGDGNGGYMAATVIYDEHRYRKRFLMADPKSKDEVIQWILRRR